MRNGFDTLSEFYERVLVLVLGKPGKQEEQINTEARRRCGAHYTTEENIMRVIRPLFLDELRAEFEKYRSNKKKQHATGRSRKVLRIDS